MHTNRCCNVILVYAVRKSTSLGLGPTSGEESDSMVDPRIAIRQAELIIRLYELRRDQ